MSWFSRESLDQFAQSLRKMTDQELSDKDDQYLRNDLKYAVGDSESLRLKRDGIRQRRALIADEQKRRALEPPT